jgi:hypothetical protein
MVPEKNYSSRDRTQCRFIEWVDYASLDEMVFQLKNWIKRGMKINNDWWS